MLRLCYYSYFIWNMLDLNLSSKLPYLTAGILFFSLIGAQSWSSDSWGIELKSNLMDKKGGFVEVYSDNTECTAPLTMHALVDELSALSVQFTIHEEQEGVIISDPIEGLIKELEQAFGKDLCTSFTKLSKQQQNLYIEIEKLLVDMRGLNIKARGYQKSLPQQSPALFS